MDVWAEWCGPCTAIEPVLEQIGDEYAGKISIAKLNIDENPQSPASHGVRSSPPMIVFQGGEAKKRIVGARPKAAMVNELKEFLG